MARYFAAHQNDLDLFPADAPGFRRPQLGAATALVAHQTRSEEAAVVVLPTGTGKTAVLQLTPYLWRSRRTLVVTPSRLVREQIAEGFAQLKLLKELGVLPAELAAPVVKVIENRISSDSDWEDLTSADVVVTTPMSASPSLAAVPTPPGDLFDVVLIDEAHHTPATSYNELLNAFPDARQALFTATPFRRDKRRLPGKIIYNYPLIESIHDQTYGKVEYVPCEPQEGQNHDVAIAIATESAFKIDASAGLDHRMMVRTDSVERAKSLLHIYREHTGLRLQLVHGGHSLKHVKSVMYKLKSGDLDGLICVDMFGEGVDFPRLKIAALHAPHKSLAVTLQFIGRFARTNADDVGAAKFIAVPQEIDAEVQALYRSGASWGELVANLADARVQEEETIREGLTSFETAHSVETGELDLTVDSLRPYFHTKVYRVDQEPNLHGTPYVPDDCELVFSSVSDDLCAVVSVARRLTKPKWLGEPALRDVKNLLYLVHYNSMHGLLFVNSVEKSEDVYDEIVGTFYDDDSDEVCIPLPHDVVSRALRMINDAKFYNVGMRNRGIGNQDESYRTLTGPAADRNVNHSDATTRSRGHVFGGGAMQDGSTTTIGISTLSKVWSNKYGLIPEFVQWCRHLADELSNVTPVATGSNVDLLNTAEHIRQIPIQPVGAVWDEHVFRHPKLIRLEGTDDERDLTGLELQVLQGTYHRGTVNVGLAIDDSVVSKYAFDPSSKPMFRRIDGPRIEVLQNPMNGSLEELLNIRPPTLFLADFSTLVGNEWFKISDVPPLDFSCIETFGEFGTSVDSQCEFSGPKKTPRSGMVSIHEFTEAQFLSRKSDVIIYDHRTGEVADYISVTEEDDVVTCELAHCKGAGGPAASVRVDDVYEVAGQIVKCLPYRRPSDLSAKLTTRIASGSKLKRGNVEKLQRILSNAERKRFDFRLCLVQPGISASKLSSPRGDGVKSVLAAAGEYVKTNTGISPSFWFSS